MQKNPHNTRLYWTQAAVIAAAYTALTLLAGALGLAWGPVQFRFSEALTILPALTPAAIPGLTIGCLLSNFFSPQGPLDLIFGTLASFLAAVLTYWTRKVTLKGLPMLGALWPVLINAVVIGALITFFIPDAEGTTTTFFVNAGFVGLGQLVCCVIGGLPLFAALRKTPVFSMNKEQ
ncbi:MAG: QueT transporter family protein [Oscillospiraceae bacterium]|jgi:uncharacterized membrane protein|nr:QueT transporter family protein [Oscillospiraceae bacterium]